MNLKIYGKMKQLRILKVAFLMLAAFTLASCSFGLFDEEKDKVEQVTLYVSAKTETYYDLFDSERANPIEGMLIMEKGGTYWSCVHFTTITDFTYEKGYDYELLVKKTTLANPPQDSSNIRYQLVKIVSQTKRPTVE